MKVVALNATKHVLIVTEQVATIVLAVRKKDIWSVVVAFNVMILV